MPKHSKSFVGIAVAIATLFAAAAFADAQTIIVASRITQAIDPANLTILHGNTHPSAQARFDRGAAPASLPMRRMLLVLKRSAQQESALDTLLEEQQDASSPNFHHWLTPQQFGQEFGPSDQDIQTITSWLQTQGFQVEQVSNGRTVIEFSGTAGEVQSAFHTAIHQYLINGENHWANSSDPEIPTALAPVVAGIASLNNFQKHAQYHVAGVFGRSKKTGIVEPISPEFTYTCGTNNTGQSITCYPLAPYDFATIYNVAPLWNQGPAVDGTGETIAIVGRTNINLTDVSQFRAVFGLPPNTPSVILNGPDPGILSSDETEADLDVEWSGAVAKGATIDFVVSQSTEASDGVDLSALYIVDNNLAPVMSESYGECELGLGQAGNQYEANLWQQAAAQGITVFVAAGDNGSAGCDPFVGQTPQPAVNGLQVNGLASTPYNVAVGGTDFNDLFNPTTYWNATNDPTTQSSAKAYIPETTWNDTCTNSLLGNSQIGFSTNPETNCNNPQLSNIIFTVAGSGGASGCTNPTGSQPGSCSGGYSKPTWQSGTGVPNDGKRDIPDVSLFAGNGFVGNFYLLCQQDISYGPCSTSNFAGVGGTSASSPAFAGIMAMVDQATGSRQGIASYALYGLAAQSGNRCTSAASPASTCVFYDIPTGSTIAVPCATGSPNCTTKTSGDANGILSGYATTAGYDEATGLGSINAANLVSAWKTFALNLKGSATSLTLTPPSGGSLTNLTHGQTVSFSATVSAVAPATGTPTGNIALIAETGASGQEQVQSVALNGAGDASGSTNALPGGTYSVIANYPGDSVFGPSKSAETSVTVNPEASKTSLRIITFDPLSGQITNPNASNFTYGSPYILRADITNSSGSTCFNSASEALSYGCPTGAINLTDNGSSLGAGSYALNSDGYTEYQAIQLAGGAHTIAGSYSGDASYNASSGTDAVTVTPAPTTTTINSPVNGTPPQTVIIGQPFNIAAQTQANSSGVAPTGTYSVLDGSSSLPASVISSSGFTIPSSNQVFLNATVQATVSAPSGSHTLTAQYNGDTNYASSKSGTVTVNALYPTTISSSVTPSGTTILGTPLTLTITINTTNPASNAALKPTGTLSYRFNVESGSGTLATSTGQDASGNWVLTGTGTITPQQPDYIIVDYSGDSNYSGANTLIYVAVTIPDFSVSVNSTPLVITAGQTGTATVTIAPATSYTSTVSLSCSGLIAGAPCSFSPSSVTLSNSAPATSTLSITVPAPSTNLTAVVSPRMRRFAPSDGSMRSSMLAAGGVMALTIFLLLLSTVRSRVARSVMALAFIGAVAFAVGCGGGGNSGSGNSGGGSGGGGNTGPAPTSTKLTASTAKIAPGASATLTATVTSSNPLTALVAFGDLTLSDYAPSASPISGTAQVQLNNDGSLPIGTHAINASYSGDPLNLPSQSGSINIVLTGSTTISVIGQTSIDTRGANLIVTVQ